MSKARICILVFMVAMLTACAGVGVMATSDPLTKLNDAEHLFMEQDRPLIAERLIKEAMEIYRERGDNHGLGHAHREYADLLLSGSVVKWRKFYKENGFSDKSVTYENRSEKAKEYYGKALKYYSLAESPLLLAEKYDSLTNLYFNMAWSSYQVGDKRGACEYYDKTLGAYVDNIKKNPDAKPIIPSGYSSFQEVIDSRKNALGCVSGA